MIIPSAKKCIWPHCCTFQCRIGTQEHYLISNSSYCGFPPFLSASGFRAAASAALMAAMLSLSAGFTYGIEPAQPGPWYYWYLSKPLTVLIIIIFLHKYRLSTEVPVLLTTLQHILIWPSECFAADIETMQPNYYAITFSS